MDGVMFIRIGDDLHEFRQIKKSALFHKNEKNAVSGNRKEQSMSELAIFLAALSIGISIATIFMNRR